MVENAQPTLLTPEASKVTENTICLVVKKGRFGVNRKVSAAALEVDADKTLLALSKCILDSPELKKVAQLDSEVQTYLKALCLKSMFSGGIYLIPLGAIEEVNDALQAFAERRQALVGDAVAAYDQRAEETAERLGVLRNALDYPSEARFRGTFYFEWQFVTWETPTRLKAIRPALFEIERQKAAVKLTAVAEECKTAMRAGMKDLVEHMVDRLTPDEDGKPKRFQKSTVANFHAFFRTFDLKNVTDDTELAAIVTQAKAVMSGVDADALRKQDVMRDLVTDGLRKIQEQLQTMTVDRSTRAIDLDGDDDDTVDAAAAPAEVPGAADPT